MMTFGECMAVNLILSGRRNYAPAVESGYTTKVVEARDFSRMRVLPMEYGTRRCPGWQTTGAGRGLHGWFGPLLRRRFMEKKVS